MSNRSCQFNMAHSLATNLSQSNFNTALLADNTTVFHTFIFTAQAFIVFNRTKNASTEQTISFRFESTIVDSFRLFNLTIRPRTDLFRRGDGNFNLVKRFARYLLTKIFHNIIHILLAPLPKLLRSTIQHSSTKI